MISRFVTSSDFCEATPTKSCHPVTCPDQCSKHGTCDKGVCKCYSGFYGENCATAKHEILFGRTKTYDGYIFGNQINTYQMFIGDEGVGKYDLHINIAKTSSLGKLHLYVYGGLEYIVPDVTHIDVLRQQFPYQNLEDTDTRTLYINELSRVNNTHITLVVLNTVDVESEYTISISSDVSGAKYNSTLVSSVLIFTGMTLLAIALAVIGVLQFISDVNFYRSIKNYRIDDSVLDDEEDELQQQEYNSN
jgi:hypothetical protein